MDSSLIMSSCGKVASTCAQTYIDLSEFVDSLGDVANSDEALLDLFSSTKQLSKLFRAMDRASKAHPSAVSDQLEFFTSLNALTSECQATLDEVVNIVDRINAGDGSKEAKVESLRQNHSDFDRLRTILQAETPAVNLSLSSINLCSIAHTSSEQTDGKISVTRSLRRLRQDINACRIDLNTGESDGGHGLLQVLQAAEGLHDTISVSNGDPTVYERIAQKRTAEEKPTEKEQVEEKLVEEKPTEEMPAEEWPAEEKPAQEKPAQEKPAEETPAQEKSIEEEPTEEKQVEEKAAKENVNDAAPSLPTRPGQDRVLQWVTSSTTGSTEIQSEAAISSVGDTPATSPFTSPTIESSRILVPVPTRERKLSSVNIDALYKSACLNLVMANFEAAERSLRRIIGTLQDSPITYPTIRYHIAQRQLAQCFLAQRNFQAAHELLQNIPLGLRAEEAETGYLALLVAIACKEEGRLGEAQESCEKAMSLSTKSPVGPGPKYMDAIAVMTTLCDDPVEAVTYRNILDRAELMFPEYVKPDYQSQALLDLHVSARTIVKIWWELDRIFRRPSLDSNAREAITSCFRRLRSCLRITNDDPRVAAVKVIFQQPDESSIIGPRNGATMLHLVAGWDDPACPTLIRILVDLGANVDATSKEHPRPPLSYAIPIVPNMRALLECGAQADPAYSGRYEYGQPISYLHLAARHGHDEVVKVLLEHGAKADKLDMHTRQITMEAAANGHAKAVAHLLTYGSNVKDAFDAAVINKKWKVTEACIDRWNKPEDFCCDPSTKGQRYKSSHHSKYPDHIREKIKQRARDLGLREKRHGSDSLSKRMSVFRHTSGSEITDSPVSRTTTRSDTGAPDLLGNTTSELAGSSVPEVAGPEVSRHYGSKIAELPGSPNRSQNQVFELQGS